MKDLFVTYQLALLAKQKGFDESCLAYYGNEEKLFITAGAILKYRPLLKAPLYQQLIDWFLEKHDIWVEILLFDRGFLEKNKFCFQWRIYNKSKEWFTSADECKTPIETMNLAFIEAFKLI